MSKLAHSNDTTMLVIECRNNPDEAAATISTLTERVKVLEEALKPFADESMWLSPHHEFVSVKASDCDAAKAVLEASHD